MNKRILCILILLFASLVSLVSSHDVKDTSISSQDELAKKYAGNSNMYNMTIKMTKFPINKDKTTTMGCQMFNTNKAVQKLMRTKNNDISYHALGWEAVINNQPLLHSITLFSCDSRNTIWNPEPFECMEMPRDCGKPLMMWSAGGKAVEIPEPAGMLWGSYDSTLTLLQMTYKNPDKKADQTDSSGLQVYFTPKLRKYDLGLLQLGPGKNIRLPPFQRSYVVNNECGEKCTGPLIDTGFNMIGYILHGHNLAKKIWADITTIGGIKDNKTVISADYSYEHQEFKMLQPAINISPNTTIQTNCEYNTMSKKSMTFGGDALTSEMCNFFLYYYPREHGLTSCNNNWCGVVFPLTRNAYEGPDYEKSGFYNVMNFKNLLGMIFLVFSVIVV